MQAGALLKKHCPKVVIIKKNIFYNLWVLLPLFFFCISSTVKRQRASPLKAASTSGQEESARPKAQKGLASPLKTASTSGQEELGSENLQSQSLFSSDGIAETNTVSPIKYTYRVQEKTVYTLPDKIATRVVSKQWVEATCLSLRDEKFKYINVQ